MFSMDGEVLHGTISQYDDIFGGIILRKQNRRFFTTLMSRIELKYSTRKRPVPVRVYGRTEDEAMAHLWGALTKADVVTVYVGERTYKYTWNGHGFKPHYAPDMCLKRSGADHDEQTYQCTLRSQHPGAHQHYARHDMTADVPMAIWTDADLEPKIV